MYVNHFASWKTEDGRRIAAGLLKAYSEMVLIAARHAEHREQAQRQMASLRGQLVHLLGQDQASLSVQQVREEIEATESAYIEPAAAETAGGAPPAPAPVFARGFLDTAMKGRKRAPPSPATPSPLSSPDQYRNWALARRLAQEPSIEELKLPESAAGRLEQQVREMMVHAMDQRFIKELAEGCHAMLSANLLQLRESMAELTPNRADLIERLQDLMPVESITAQEGVPVDVTRLRLLLDSVVQTILELEAPAQNQETTDWHAQLIAEMEQQQAHELIPRAIRWLLARVHRIKLDIALVQAQHLLKTQGVQYEQNLVASSIQDGSFDLAALQAWLDQQVLQLSELHVKPSPSTVVSVGLASLLSNSPQALPQLLELDTELIQKLRAGVDRIVQLLVLLLALRPALRAPVTEAEAYALLQASVSEGTRDASLSALLSVAEQLEVAQIDQAILERMASNSVNPLDAVNKLIHRRVSTCLIRALTQQQPLSDAYLTSQGLSHAKELLLSVCHQAAGCVDRTCAAYGPVITEMLWN